MISPFSCLLLFTRNIIQPRKQDLFPKNVWNACTFIFSRLLAFYLNVINKSNAMFRFISQYTCDSGFIIRVEFLLVLRARNERARANKICSSHTREGLETTEPADFSNHFSVTRLFGYSLPTCRPPLCLLIDHGIFAHSGSLTISFLPRVILSLRKHVKSWLYNLTSRWVFKKIYTEMCERARLSLCGKTSLTVWRRLILQWHERNELFFFGTRIKTLPESKFFSIFIFISCLWLV